MFTKDRYGLRRDYCQSFIGSVWLNGSGVAKDDEVLKADLGYENPITYKGVNAIIYGSDGTPVEKDKTVARDRDFDQIMSPGTYVTLSNSNGFFGGKFLANDVGSRNRIKGYRLDVYRGRGEGACSPFANPVVMGVCSVGSAKCPDSRGGKRQEVDQ